MPDNGPVLWLLFQENCKENLIMYEYPKYISVSYLPIIIWSKEYYKYSLDSTYLEWQSPKSEKLLSKLSVKFLNSNQINFFWTIQTKQSLKLKISLIGLLHSE